jgi:ATP-dependent exoDNAse (exonuclease V) beta subunit
MEGRSRPQVIDGGAPSEKVENLDEERRYLYVAMTRAKDELNPIASQRFHLGPSTDRNSFQRKYRSCLDRRIGLTPRLGAGYSKDAEPL